MIDFTNTPKELKQYVLERQGCRLHYWLGGAQENPLVVFMHGATMDHRMFNAQVEALIPDYRLLIWDARGHGRSKPLGSGFSLDLCAQDMLAILDDIQETKAVIGGQSLGGYIAQHIYFSAPQRVQGMIIIGATPISKPYSKWEVWALKSSLSLFHIWPYNHFARTVAKYTAVTRPVQEYALQAIHMVDRSDFLRIWKAVTLAIDDKGLPGHSIDVPLLLLHGDQDKVGTIRRDMPIWAKMENQVTYQVIPDAGHNANQDNPQFTNRAVLEFLHQIYK